MLLVSAKRGQSLHFLDTNDFVVKKNSITMYYPNLLEESRPGNSPTPLYFRAYVPDKRLCVVHYIKNYLQRTKDIRKTTKFFISYAKPHKAISKDTLRRYVKTIMAMAGLEESYKPHSTRAAATSKAQKAEIPLHEILNKAGWSNAKTFAKYYNKTITTDVDTFQQAVLTQ